MDGHPLPEASLGPVPVAQCADPFAPHVDGPSTLEASLRLLVDRGVLANAVARGGLLACTSPRFDDIFGLSAGRAHGMPFLDLVATVDQERVAEALAPFAAEQPEARVRAEHVQLTFDALRTDGSVFEAELLVDHPRSPANNLALGGDL